MKEKERQVIEKGKREKERRKRGKELSRRTRKGQPVMGSVISHMLQKLQNENDA
jgi:hypothetical protein